MGMIPPEPPSMFPRITIDIPMPKVKPPKDSVKEEMYKPIDRPLLPSEKKDK